MTSPGHKKNILAEHISQLDIDTLYYAQEFSGTLTVEE